MAFNIKGQQSRVVISYMIILLVLPASLSVFKGVPRGFNPWVLTMFGILLAVVKSHDMTSSFSKQLFLSFIIGLLCGFAAIVGFVLDYLIFSIDKKPEYVMQMLFSFYFYSLMIAWGIFCMLAAFSYKNWNKARQLKVRGPIKVE